ncbi:phytanoyl-CoA dioxygenase family protein [Sulfitobacter sp.]|uniref:phytanoyl-CoA dioxygenase family protein n=1 Tax=Sulfitobacter sp. TaxID=1903071 RepID=UPI003002C4F8
MPNEIDTPSMVAGWKLEKASLDSLGYSSPLPLDNPQRARCIFESNNAIGSTTYVKNPHVTSDVVRQMLCDAGLVRAVESLCGPSFKLWRSAFFSKSEGSGEIGWHHDKHFEAGDADIQLNTIGGHYSILFGLTDITHTTGLLEIIPGTHRDVYNVQRDTRPFHLRPASAHILTDLPIEAMAMRRPVPIPAGCFMIFHSAMLHRSLSHTSGARRLGMAIRLVHQDREIPAPLAKREDIFPFPPIL